MERKIAEIVAPITTISGQSGGFFTRSFTHLMGWLSGSVSAEKAAAQPANINKTAQEQSDVTRPDRNNRNRNRNRNSRNRRDTEEQATLTAPVSKQVKAVITDAPVSETTQRPTKTPRPPKQERETQEARRERQQREREERAAKKAANEATNATQVQDQPTSAIVHSELTASSESAEKLNQVVGDENQEVGDDEPRRRRRRGGRNRNRRDRESGENVSAENANRDVNDDFIPVADIANAEQHQATIQVRATEVGITAIASKPTPVELNQSVTLPELTATTPVSSVAPTPAKPVELLATIEQVELRFETKSEPVSKAIPTEEPKVHLTESTTPVLPSVNPAPTVTKVEDLQDMLQAAGLVLAATDPTKLQQAQVNAAPAPVRKPRVRKPAAEVSNEPLELVQTKHDE